MKIPFVKMHGAANDFVVIDHRRPFLPEPLTPLMQRLCDRRRGIGADGVLLIERDSELDFAMRYFNADGCPAEFCGNGARCVARRALELGLGRSGEVRFRTAVGPKRALGSDGGGIELQFGRVAKSAEPVVVDAAGRSFVGRLIRVGVPHFVTPVERVEWTPLAEWGPALRHHPGFGPEGANVDFVARLGPGRIALRTYERGVEAETLACGSGAMAASLGSMADGDRPPISVMTAGGDELRVGLTEVGDQVEVTLMGPAETVHAGEWTGPVPAPAARD
ncbi:MAG TPA: diaminopimelate epimerase [Candidatus Eisenbacteria bacterium]|jgi:diaminopimelate epimerase